MAELTLLLVRLRAEAAYAESREFLIEKIAAQYLEDFAAVCGHD